jgi:hypothetical protein
MNSSIAEINAILFENTDKIPEGLYLQLMNLTGKVYKELTDKSKPKVEQTIVRYDTQVHRLDSIDTWDYLRDFMEFLDKDTAPILPFRLSTGDVFQVVAEGLNLEFYEVIKINRCKVHFIKWFAEYFEDEKKYVWYDSKIEFKTSELLNKNIFIYYKTRNEINKLFNATIYKTFEEHPRHNDFSGNNMPNLKHVQQ